MLLFWTLLGQLSWYREAFTITADTHTFEEEKKFTKNNDNIDRIRFPTSKVYAVFNVRMIRSLELRKDEK
jgi:hypothetical protein